MLNPKQMSRKKSLNLISIKQTVQTQMKRKKSVSNLAVPSKLKKQSERQMKDNKKVKQQKKVTHSLSKGKISKKYTKPQRNDQNVNNMNHKKSVQKLQTTKAPKQSKAKASTDEITYDRKQEKRRHPYTQHTLSKTNSEYKLTVKKTLKKKPQSKQCIEQRHLRKNEQQRHKLELHDKYDKLLPKKSLTVKICKSKRGILMKSKLKKSTLHPDPQRSLRPKLKNNKISEIIQKSILYSDVNYDFKEQTSQLGSGTKRQEDVFPLYPYDSVNSGEQVSQQSKRRKRAENQAATTIQKHYRGYIQRKYIEQARYIIDSIKKIQRFWRSCLQKRDSQNMNKPQMVRGLIQTSLVTIKDLKDMCKVDRKPSIQVQEKQAPLTNSSLHENELKNIIKNLLSEQNLNETIKQKIRNVIACQQSLHKQQQKSKNSLSQLITQHQAIQTKNERNKRPETTLSELQLLNESQNHKNSKQFYVKKKINKEIDSQRCFNSPMNSSNQFLTSPGMKKFTSPKCLSSSFSKDVKSSYSNGYFKSTKNVNSIFCSPKRSLQQNMKFNRSHSGNKTDKQVDVDHQHPGSNQHHKNVLDKSFQQPYRQRQPTSHSKNLFPRQQYLFNSGQICSTSPIVKCKQTSVQEQINLLSSQKVSSANFLLQPQNQITQAVNVRLKPFPTQFCLIEEFCLLITDYLREDEQTTQIFLEKLKGLKFYKLENIFKDWQKIQFQQYCDDNQLLKQMIMRETCNRPNILSKSEKKMLIQYPSLRLFLNQNDYSDNQIFNQSSPHHSYIRFMFDVFQQCIYQNFKHYSLANLGLANKKQSRKDIDYLSLILSQSMGNMLKSAQILCGSFQTQEMTQLQKQERYLINEQRMQEMMKQWKEDDFDPSSCEIWIQLLVGKMVFEQMVKEVAREMKNF